MATLRKRNIIFKDGDWFRRDGRPVRLEIDGAGCHLVAPLAGHRDPVDTLTLATLLACGRLKRHDPRPPARRRTRLSRRGGHVA